MTQMTTRSSRKVDVVIADGLDTVTTCLAIRSAAFVGRGEPMEEEFDGNDFVGSVHLLARRGGKPVGTMRLRLVAAGDGGTMVWERLAVLPGHRDYRILLALARAALRYSTMKGCRWAVGLVADGDDNHRAFWERRGAEALQECERPVFGGVPYQVMRQRLPDTNVAGDPVSLLSGRESRLFYEFMGI